MPFTELFIMSFAMECNLIEKYSSIRVKGVERPYNNRTHFDALILVVNISFETPSNETSTLAGVKNKRMEVYPHPHSKKF